MQQNWIQIAGNCDRRIVRQSPADQGASDRFAFHRLTPHEIRWLSDLPTTASTSDGILAFHGTPTNDEVYLLETVEDGKVRLASDAEVLQRLNGVAAELILCGHSHIPRIFRIGDTLTVNPGSIGLPAYTNDEPEFHIMESGSVDATYAFVEKRSGSWRAELIAVPYPHLAAAEQAQGHGRADWAVALRTGYVT
jgi:predicted phosphodiesterase